MKLKHVNLTARNADLIASFYKEAFEFEERRPPKLLSGDVVSRGNGLPNTEVYTIWLNVNHDGGPFLEIMEYSETAPRSRPLVNEPGYGHLAFEVGDLSETVEKVLQFGGALQGEVTNFGTEKTPFLIVYVRDPEGNVIELEQAP